MSSKRTSGSTGIAILLRGTGYIRWVSDFASIPQKHGVGNVYGEAGAAFANSAVANPRFAAALMGTLIKGMGVDHVV